MTASDGTASDAALRMRRVRACKAGDHSACAPKNCSAALALAAAAIAAGQPEQPPESERVPGDIETAVEAYVDALPYGEGDPRALLAGIAVKLARRVDETGAMPAAVRELRVLLVQLVEVPNGPAGRVDEIRLRAAQRRLDAMLAQA